MSTWKSMILSEMQKHSETWEDVIHTAIKAQEDDWDDAPLPSFDREFDPGYGGPEGDYFTVWTTNRVYFPIVYDGAESVGSAPRNPSEEAVEHMGGW